MFCLKCGEAIPDKSKVCPLCGADLETDDKQAVVYASQKGTESIENDLVNKNKTSKGLAWILSGIAIGVVILVVVLSIQKSTLKKDLENEWLDIDGPILKVLEFTDDEVEYRLETGYSWMDTTLFVEKYKVIAGNKIKIQRFDNEWKTYTIELNDDKTIMTITPAVTSTDESENWYNID